MNLPIIEIHPQHLPPESQIFAIHAKQILIITPICFNNPKNETVRLYYHAASTDRRHNSVTLERCDKEGKCSSFLTVSLRPRRIDRKEAEVLAPDSHAFGYTLEGFCKMLEKLSPFFDDLAEKEKEFLWVQPVSSV